MLKDPKYTAIIANAVLEIVCRQPSQAYAHAITKTLKANRGNGFTHALDVGSMLRMLTKEGVLEEGGLQPGKGGKMRIMYRPTWKAFFFLDALK